MDAFLADFNYESIHGTDEQPFTGEVAIHYPVDIYLVTEISELSQVRT